MTNEKRGIEKLLELEDDLCPLTEEELAQVAGGWSLPTPIEWGKHGGILKDIYPFPYGIFPPEHFEQLGKLNHLVKP